MNFIRLDFPILLTPSSNSLTRTYSTSWRNNHLWFHHPLFPFTRGTKRTHFYTFNKNTQCRIILPLHSTSFSARLCLILFLDKLSTQKFIFLSLPRILRLGRY